MKKNFAVIGCGGFVASRHLKAITETGHGIVAACDPHDSVGILDEYSDDVRFFTEFERFDRHAEKLRKEGEEKRIHWVSICSPNYLHDSHVRFAFRIGADAICEKPLVINPWNLDQLTELEKESGRKVYNILQLRHHPEIIGLRESVAQKQRQRHTVDLTYVASRGPWYDVSWKGNEEKSGGLAMNLGIHLFDMLLWTFGMVRQFEIAYGDSKLIRGHLDLEKADVNWTLSSDKKYLPPAAVQNGKKTYRSISVDGREIEFTQGFERLHTQAYREILAGRGYGISDCRPGIELVYKIREQVKKISPRRA